MRNYMSVRIAIVLMLFSWLAISQAAFAGAGKSFSVSYQYDDPKLEQLLEEDIKRLQTQKPRPARYYLELADLATINYLKGRKERAKQILYPMVAEVSGADMNERYKIEVWLSAAKIFQRVGDLGQAERLLRSAVTMEKNRGATFVYGGPSLVSYLEHTIFLLARVLHQQGKTALAKKELQKEGAYLKTLYKNAGANPPFNLPLWYPNGIESILDELRVRDETGATERESQTPYDVPRQFVFPRSTPSAGE